MVFKIERASDHSNKKPPHKNAVFLKENYWGEKEYSIEINSLEQLLSVANEYGIVLSKENEKWEIVIYDGYIE